MSKKLIAILLMSLIMNTVTLALILGVVVPELSRESNYTTVIEEGDTIINQTVILYIKVKLKLGAVGSYKDVYRDGKQYYIIIIPYHVYNVTLRVGWPYDFTNETGRYVGSNWEEYFIAYHIPRTSSEYFSGYTGSFDNPEKIVVGLEAYGWRED